MRKDPHIELLNTLLVETFNEILKVEEQSLRLATQGTVTVTEIHTLDAIGTGEPRTITELAAATMVTVSTMTIAVNRLAAKGLVERVRDTEDRRIVRVRLTHPGEVLVRAHQRFHRRMTAQVTEQLSPEELEVLAGAMNRLRDFFKNENKQAGLNTDFTPE